MAFLGVDEKKAVDAIAEKLHIGPADSAISILETVLMRVMNKLSVGQQIHAIITVKGVVVDVTVSVEAKS